MEKWNGGAKGSLGKSFGGGVESFWAQLETSGDAIFPETAWNSYPCFMSRYHIQYAAQPNILGADPERAPDTSQAFFFKKICTPRFGNHGSKTQKLSLAMWKKTHGTSVRILRCEAKQFATCVGVGARGAYDACARV